MMRLQTDNLVKILNPTLQSNKQLICIPFAGGYSTAFRPLLEQWQSDWQIVTVDPPGHGANQALFVEDIEELVDLYLERLEPCFQGTFSLLGHSMGAKIVHRMAQKLESKGIDPQLVIVSAGNPPSVPQIPVTHLGDDAFWDFLISLGGIPEELLQYPELLELYLPIFRSDFATLEKYENKSESILKTPLHVFYGTKDQICSEFNTLDWLSWAEQVEFTAFDEGHMFLTNKAVEFASTVQKLLRC